jgi:hypothetical protein
LKEFGETYLGGKSEKTAKRRVLEDGIPHHRDHGHILIKQSDAEKWRESRTVESETPTLKSMVRDIAAQVWAKRKKS